MIFLIQVFFAIFIEKQDKIPVQKVIYLSEFYIKGLYGAYYALYA